MVQAISGMLVDAFFRQARDVAMRAAADIMSRRLVIASPGSTALEARSLCQAEATTHILVMESRDLVGTLCSCDLFSARPHDRVSWLMSRHVITIDPDTSIESAAKLMRHTGVGFLPVAAKGQVLGVVTRGDLGRIGLPLELTGPICSSCGSHHHVRPSIGHAEPRLCCECADRAHPPSKVERFFIDLGVGD